MADSSDDEIELHDNESLITDDEDEVLPSDDSEDDEDDYDDDDDDLQNDKFSRFKIERKKDEMASDIEDDEEEEDSRVQESWGKSKHMFYNTDYVDKDFRSQKQKDEDLAKYEEEEALAIQKRLLESVSEKDLGLDFVIDTKPKAPKDDTKDVEQKKSQKVELDLSTLKKDQKLAIIKKESPELELLVADLKKYLHEVKTELEPVLKCLQQHPDALSTSGLKYLKLRYLVLLNYCTNISFYLSLMSSHDKQNVKEHPIIKKIFMHKKLIAELDSCVDKKGKKFSKEMDIVFQCIQQNSEIPFEVEDDEAEDELLVSTDMSRSKLAATTALDLDDEVSEPNEEEEDGKRAITYEMEKNKGLIPKRKREQRNPRVKYRKKFDKAMIRRKGQVRAPRKEVKKYGGEMTGINTRTVKSVKFR